MAGRWLRAPGTPLGWMLVLSALVAAGLALAPDRPSTGVHVVHAAPDPDDDDDDDWIVPAPRQEIAI